MSADRHETGLKVRRQVLGDAHVDRAEAATTRFDAAFQRMINEGAWGAVWARPNWTLRERSMVTLALLAALGHFKKAVHLPVLDPAGDRLDSFDIHLDM